MSQQREFYSPPRWLGAKEFLFDLNPMSLIDSFVADRRFPKVLDCGCGIGSLIKQLAPILDYERIIGVDFNDELLRQAMSNCRTTAGATFQLDSVEALSFPDDSFDLVMTQEMLEHISNQELALREMCRVLKPEGVLLCLRNFDARMTFSPSSGIRHSDAAAPDIDALVTETFNTGHFILKGKAPDAGRRLPHLARNIGTLQDVVSEPTPWIVQPGGLSDEQYDTFFGYVLHFIEEAGKLCADAVRKGYIEGRGLVDEHRMQAWLDVRRSQVSDRALSLEVAYLSFAATKM